MGLNKEIKKREEKNRNKIKENKPEVWKKIEKAGERIKNKQSIALVQFQIDYNCPLRCKHCAITKFRDFIPEPMSIENIKKIADEIHDYGLWSICISGGEPFSFPNLEEIIDNIDPQRFVISIDTSGMFLDEEKIKWLVDKGVDRLHLSIDGLETNHDDFRRSKGLWKKNLDNLPFFKKYGLGVVINTVATKNIVRSGDLEKQLKYLEPFKEHSSLIYPKPVGTFEEAKDQVLNQEDFNYLETLAEKYNCSTHLTENHGTYFGCLCYKRHFSILPNGESLPCPWIPISIGNVLDEGVETVIQRGLTNPWFSFDNCFTCHSGNEDSYFYQNIIPQIDNFPDEYPVHYSKIDWKLDYFKKGE